jgi:hypothetical protein
VNGEGAAGGLGVRADEWAIYPIADDGHLLLTLTSRDVQGVADLAAACGRSATDAVRSLRRLVDQGFLIAGDLHGAAVYQLRPKAEPSSMSDLAEHTLLIGVTP